MPRIYNLTKYVDRRRSLRRDSSKAEVVLWNALKTKQFMGLKFRRQHSIGNYIADFYCRELRLVVEVDGDSHGAVHQQAYDRRRTAWLQSMFFRVVRFTNDDVLHNLDGTLERLREFITSSSLAPDRVGGARDTPPQLKRGFDKACPS
ncbi:MAG: endonuclease domain-containing protein [Candidatus Kerfeldbacteria bacterium]|nr:endonuclease domain-containing protein [Candidatus Kerfeldbacteria bacterium]